MSDSCTGVSISSRSGQRRTLPLSPSWSACSHGATAAVRSGAEQIVRDATDLTAAVAPWLQADHDGLTGTVLKWPERDEIDTPVQEQLIVELYSK